MNVAPESLPAESRRTCPDCGRPGALCYCAHVTPLRTRTRVVVLQHPREARVPLGTLGMVRLGLPEAVIRKGVDFSADPVVAALCAEQPAPHVLFPGPEARDLSELAPGQLATLVVIDGTWAQAKQLLRRNPALAALPRVAFAPGAPSAYRIRRQPAPHCVSTVEAIARALDAIEGPPGRFEQALLRPLHALVDDQLRFSREQQAYRRCRPRQPGPNGRRPPPDSPTLLRARWERLVCVQGEVNAWPRRHPDGHPPELVEWRAERLASGEAFACTIAPRRPLGPRTPDHTGLSVERLRSGAGWEAFAARWAAFLRPEDELAAWGGYFPALAAAEGLRLPKVTVDLRRTARMTLDDRPGSVEACADRLGLTGDLAPDAGRCARRMALLAQVARRLRDENLR